jgi:hypothetical protein
MFTLKGPQIHFWVSEKAVCQCEPPATNSEAGECCTSLPTQQLLVEDQKTREFPPTYFHVEIF